MSTTAAASRTRSSIRARRIRVYTIGSLMVLGLLLLVFYRYIFVTILPGNVGVLYSWLLGGTRVEKVYGEGLALKLPWNRIYIVDTRVQRHQEKVLALSAEGMEVEVEVSTLYRPYPEQAGTLVRELGPEYGKRIVQTLTSGATREIISRFNSTELFTNDFTEMEGHLYDEMDGSRYGKIIDFQEIVISRITLPDPVLEAISEKLALEQRASAYVFRLERQRQEAERLRIEAIGIQNFYAIVSGALTENLLTWRGIEATVELARSPNSKVVIVGGGKDQLPLILGSDIHNLPPAKAVAAVSPTAVPEPEWSSMPEIFAKDGSSSQGVDAAAQGVDGEHDPEPEAGDEQPDGKQPEDGESTATATDGDDENGGAGNNANDNDPASDPTQGLAPEADDVGLRGERPLVGFRILPKEMESPESTRAPYGAKTE